MSLEGSGSLKARAVNYPDISQTDVLSAASRNSLFQGSEGDRLNFGNFPELLLKEEGISSYLLGGEGYLTCKEAALSCLYPPAAV